MRVTIESRPRVPVQRYRDMRIDRWELYQRPRPVPILKPDLPQCFIQSLDTLDGMVEDIIRRAREKVRYAYATANQRGIIFNAPDGAVVADLVNELAIKHDMHTDSMRLEDPIHVYRNNTLCVILMDYLDHPDYVNDWPWDRALIRRMPALQRGIPAKCSVANKIYDPSPYYLMKPTTEPRSITPLENERPNLKRAGMPSRTRQPDPKTIMMGWAEQKVRDEASEAQGETISMMMCAEPRTVTAIMHAKSPAQTKQGIAAAFCRAGLPSPFHPSPQQRQPSDPNLVAITHAITEQTNITADIVMVLPDTEIAALSRPPTTHEGKAQRSYVQAVEVPAQSVVRLEHSIPGRLHTCCT